MSATATICRVCGEPIEREPGTRGRPPVTHPACRAKPTSHKRISPAQSGESENKPRDPRMALHPFKVDAHPIAWRWCAICGREKRWHPVRPVR